VPGLLLFAVVGVWELWSAGVNANYRRGSLYLSLLTLSTWFVSIPKQEASLWALDSYNSGWQALQSNQLAVAEQKLDLAYAYVPENAELNFALGNLRLAQGNRTAAKGFYFATLRLDPRHEGSFNNLGVLALEESRWNLAAKFFRRAIEQGPDDAKTHYLLAKALLRMGERENARSEIFKAIVLNPNQPEFLKLRDEIR
jgi:Flp pilus assembly protein TadD